MTGKIVKCTCIHEIQDKLYGVGNRVANETRSGQYRCTVCGNLVGTVNPMTSPSKKPATTTGEPKKAESKKPEDNKKQKKNSLKGGKR